MKKYTPHLDFYFKYMQSGYIPDTGLCCCDRHGISQTVLDLFSPTSDDTKTLLEGGMAYGFWGSGLKRTAPNKHRYYGFTELRQTIVLLMAAINNEL